MLENNVSLMNISHYPSATLILNEAEIETVLSVVNNLAELAVGVLIVRAS
jgi:hypothetical protein